MKLEELKNFLFENDIQKEFLDKDNLKIFIRFEKIKEFKILINQFLNNFGTLECELSDFGLEVNLKEILNFYEINPKNLLKIK